MSKFSKHNAFDGQSSKTKTMRSPESKLMKMTVLLVETMYGSDSEKVKKTFIRPRRLLTTPSSRKWFLMPANPENPDDNKDSDLIVRVGDTFRNSKKNKSYDVKDMFGKGAFGQVFHVQEQTSGINYAAKVIKSLENYYEYTLNYEVKVLAHVNKYERSLKKGQVTAEGVSDPSSAKIVKLRDQFDYKGHMVLIFEKLEMSLYDLLKIVKFDGLTLNVIRLFGAYILEGLHILQLKKITHCDLKPENIMLVK